MATRTLLTSLAVVGVTIGVCYAIAPVGTFTEPASAVTANPVTQTPVDPRPSEQTIRRAGQELSPRHRPDLVESMRRQVVRSSARIDALGEQVAELRKAQATLERNLLERADAEMDGLVRETDDVRDIETMRRERIEAFEDGIRSEDVDLAWSTKISQEIERALGPDDGESLDIYDIDCRSSRCLVALRHDSDASFAAFQDVAIGKLGELLAEMEFYYEQVGDGSIETTIFLRRGSVDAPS